MSNWHSATRRARRCRRQGRTSALSDAAWPNDSLVGSLDGFARSLRQLRSQLRKGDLATIQAGLGDFTDGSRKVSKEIRATIAAIDAKLRKS